MLQEVLVHLGQKVRRGRKVLQARRGTLDPQVLRALRESQVQQDLSVLQETSVRLDQLVQQVRQDRKA